MDKLEQDLDELNELVVGEIIEPACNECWNLIFEGNILVHEAKNLNDRDVI